MIMLFLLLLYDIKIDSSYWETMFMMILSHLLLIKVIFYMVIAICLFDNMNHKILNIIHLCVHPYDVFVLRIPTCNYCIYNCSRVLTTPVINVLCHFEIIIPTHSDMWGIHVETWYWKILWYMFNYGYRIFPIMFIVYTLTLQNRFSILSAVSKW